MFRKVKLKGEVHLEKDGVFIFTTQLCDESIFSLKVPENFLEMEQIPKLGELPVSCYLHVTQQAQQNNMSYIALPVPSLEFGKNITVLSHQVVPIKASIKSFNVKKIINKINI